MMKIGVKLHVPNWWVFRIPVKYITCDCIYVHVHYFIIWMKRSEYRVLLVGNLGQMNITGPTRSCIGKLQSSRQYASIRNPLPSFGASRFRFYTETNTMSRRNSSDVIWHMALTVLCENGCKLLLCLPRSRKSFCQAKEDIDPLTRRVVFHDGWPWSKSLWWLVSRWDTTATEHRGWKCAI